MLEPLHDAGKIIVPGIILAVLIAESESLWDADIRKDARNRYSGFPAPPFFSVKYLYTRSSILALICDATERPIPTAI